MKSTSDRIHITVLGAGLVGSAIIKDLALESNYTITAVDLDENRLSDVKRLENVVIRQGSVVDTAFFDEVCKNADLVICAVPGFLGYATLEKIIQLGKDVVDISFFPEDALELHDLAFAKGVTAVVDCGVAPGLCNIQAGYVQSRMKKVDSYVCYVGGLPRTREWPFEYKAVFSPADVIEEYTRPARFVEYGTIVTKDALTDLEKINFPGVGTLEAFNTDGLRSLLFTLDAPFKKEKTLRYTGHVELMRAFRDSGFFSNTPILVDGLHVVPLQVTSKLLFDQWKMGPGDEDLTVMQVQMTGKENGEQVRYTFDLLDFYDASTSIHSMARTTGYTCTIIARQVLSGLFSRKGISPPEYIGQTKGCYANLLEEYKKRGIVVRELKESIA
ncbi:MAG: saccharopine dehydrogenase NADP-binding domain-containing protein [Bacteroidetes bacterium]|nr:saccharopine dehydrogenase NADP-binding domain-containing protein [Bacteroidota bacterium]